MIKQISIFIAITVFLFGCATAPSRPATFVAPNGENWVFSYDSSPVSGSIHLKINGDIIASGSHGLFFGNNASGKGTYKGHEIYFHSSSRGKSTVIIYVDWEEVATLTFSTPK